MFIRPVVLMVFLVSCSTNRPTPYQKEKKHEGFNDSTFDELQVATFRGNSNTKPKKARLYAQFRAIELCISQNKHANIVDIIDKTLEKSVLRSSGLGPSYSVGMFPYYGRYSSFGLGAGMSNTSYDSWTDILIYPNIEVLYNCSEKIFRPLLAFRELSADQMKHLVQDVKGALQVEKIEADSPNGKNIQIGDIIIKANNKRIERVHQLNKKFSDSKTELVVDLIREGKRMKEKILGSDITSEIDQTEKEIIKRVCKDKKRKKQEALKKNTLCGPPN